MAPEGLSGLTLQLWGWRRASHLLGPCSLQELAAAVTNFRARCPSLCTAAAAVGSGFSGSRTTPSPPRPPEGWSCARGL